VLSEILGSDDLCQILELGVRAKLRFRITADKLITILIHRILNSIYCINGCFDNPLNLFGNYYKFLEDLSDKNTACKVGCCS